MRIMSRPNQNDRLVVHVNDGYQIWNSSTLETGSHWTPNHKTYTREGIVREIERNVFDSRFSHLQYVASDIIVKSLGCEYVKAIQ